MSRVPSVLLALLLILPGAADGASCVTDVRTAGATSSSPDEPVIAVAAGDDALGSVMQDGETGEFRFVRRSWSLDPLDAGVAVAPAGSKIGALVYHAEGWSLFYRNSQSQIVRQRISAIGVPTGAPVVLFPAEGAVPGDVLDVEVTADGGFVIARTISGFESPGVGISRFTAAGVLIAANVFYGPQAESPNLDLEPVGSGWVILWDRRIGEEEMQSLAFYDAGLAYVTSRAPSTGARGGLIEYDGEKLILVARKQGTPPAIVGWILSATGDIESETVLLPLAQYDVLPIDLLSDGTDFTYFYHRATADSRRVRILEFHRAADKLILGDDIAYPRDSSDADFRATSLPAWTGRSWVLGTTRFAIPMSGSVNWISSLCRLDATIDGLPSVVERLQRLTLTANVEGGKSPYQATWTFKNRGEDEERFGSSVDYQFVLDGETEITLTARDNLGQTTTTTRKVNVVLSLPPLGATFRGPAGPVKINQEFVLSAETTNAVAPVVVRWTLGDGRVVTGTSVTVSYPSPGSRTILVEAKDAAGRTVNGTLAVTVEAEAPIPPSRTRLVRRP